MDKIDRLLGIEKKLGITITMPQICYFCEEEVTEKHGTKSESLLFHSLDGNHDNWERSNKVPAHKGCHTSYELKGKTLSEEAKAQRRAQMRGHSKKFINIGKSNVIVIPKAWSKSRENESGKKMVGVHLEMLNGKIELIPMWEDEK